MKEDNKLIAEFMNLNVVTINDIKRNKNPYIQSADGYTIEELQYNTSWDWLVPVVQKIEQECEGVPQELLRVSIYSDIRDVHQAVVKFIKNPYEKNPNVEWIFHQQGTEGAVGVLKTDNEND